MPTTDSLPTRQSLLLRLRNLEDTQSWKEFFEQYRRRLTGIARSQGLSYYEAEDVAHEVFKRVARTICGYEFSSRPGAFRRWLFNLTRWRSIDQLRERLRTRINLEPAEFSHHETMNDRTLAIERVPAPPESETACDVEARHYLVETLLKRVEHCVSPKQLQIFQLLMLEELAPAKVAELYGMTLTAVYVTKHRVATKLREELSSMQLPVE